MEIEVRKGFITVSGYVNAVERFSREICENGKKFIEKIESGAFKRALETNKNIKMLFNHNDKKVLASQENETLELSEDNIGLKVRAKITDEDVIKDAVDGNLTGWSFGFRCIKDSWEDEKRTVKELELFEVSLLNVEPAYFGTSVEIRNDNKIELRKVECIKVIDMIDEIEDENQEKRDITLSKEYIHQDIDNFLLKHS